MSKLSKKEAKLHQEAIALIRADRALTEDEQALVLDQFQEGAAHMNGLAGAFFTPRGLARDFAIEVVHSGGSRRRRVLDLCAGIDLVAVLAGPRQADEGGEEPLQ